MVGLDPCEAATRPVFLNFHKRCDRPEAPLETVRIAQLLSRGARAGAALAHGE